MYRLLRPLLFRFDAETIHRFAMKLMRFGLAPRLVRSLVRAIYFRNPPELRQTIWGLDFPNPVGLAAGFDKNAECVNPLGAFGFGFLEIGTVTGQGQSGNERPRLFRLEEDDGLLNRMGFNNHGSKVVSRRLSNYDIEPLLGVNIGKSKAVPLEEAERDY